MLALISSGLLGDTPPWVWGAFLVMVLIFLALDLGVFNREPHAITNKEAAVWSAIWIALALVFNVGVWIVEGGEKGLEFLTGYLIEKSLSVDNLFVMVLVFTSFGVPKKYQHRVLFWGILGALVSRGVMILLGAALVQRFEWILYIFGAFLVFTGIRMLVTHGDDPDPQNNLALRLFRRFVPTTDTIDGGHFLTKGSGGRTMATPLLVALVVIEAMDIVFAVDSIPAIFAVTTDPFIIFTSNVFAILGLRSLYFLLANVIEHFSHLQIGLAIILAYVGVKMLLGIVDIHIHNLVSLGLIISILLITTLTSVLKDRRNREAGGGSQ